MKHVSASANHYDFSADRYDAIYEKNQEINDEVIAKILKNKRTVLDLSCGTGQQAVYLAKKGFSVTGVDINKKMLAVARSKKKKFKLNCSFSHGDMRTSQMGSFDAVITIFNAIGHLTKSDFQKAMKNIAKNLNPRGLYVFDIFNLDFMLDGTNVTNLTIDQMVKEKNRVLRKIQYSTVTKKGILASHTTSIAEALPSGRVREARGSQTLQIYTVEMLKEMLDKAGFSLYKKFDIQGHRFHKKKTKHMLLVAKKK